MINVFLSGVPMCHVLIIEDEWLIADLLMSLAEEAGATSTAIAITEDEAVAAARDQLPSIILSDVNLQAGTGPDAVRTIIAEAGHIPVIFITATPEQCRPDDPPGLVLRKPVLRHNVLNAFRQLAPV
jgi:CheY-like chemotaxis protein